MMQVVVPQGVSAGQPMVVQSPAGGQIQVVVPAGVGPGMAFQFAVQATE